ncbi:MAG: hypothetical protein SangKO_099950 [Sandaracinaceae bacterium]
MADRAQLFNIPRCIPGPLIGTLRLLADKSRSPDELARLAMPTSAFATGKDPDRNAFEENLRGIASLDLAAESDGRLVLDQDLPTGILDGTADPSEYALVFLDRICAAKDTLAFALAWFLSLDPYDGGYTTKELLEALNASPDKEATRLTNKNLVPVMGYWGAALGLLWTTARRDSLTASSSTPVYIPDPTAHLRRRLPTLLSNREVVPVRELMHRLAESCPIFEGGAIRDAVSTPPPSGALSRSTAFALLRLHDEQSVHLEARGDSQAVTAFPDGTTTQRFTHIALASQQ